MTNSGLNPSVQFSSAEDRQFHVIKTTPLDLKEIPSNYKVIDPPRCSEYIQEMKCSGFTLISFPRCCGIVSTPRKRVCTRRRCGFIVSLCQVTWPAWSVFGSWRCSERPRTWTYVKSSNKSTTLGRRTVTAMRGKIESYLGGASGR